MDSTLAVQQYIQQLIKKDPSNIEAILTMPESQDEGVWKYEHLRYRVLYEYTNCISVHMMQTVELCFQCAFSYRQFCMELNGLAVRLQAHCVPSTCTQMTATEQWIFLCAAHKTPKECPAIDYTRHTLDGAACLLNSCKYFPSR